jgi:hypothetical protein
MLSSALKPTADAHVASLRGISGISEGSACGWSPEDHADSAPLTSGPCVIGIDQLAMTVDGAKVAPETIHLTIPVSRVKKDVVQRHDSSSSDEARVHVEVSAHAVVGVIAVDEQEVDLAPVEEPLELLERCLRVRVSSNEMKLLPCARVALETGCRFGAVPATEVATWKIDADDHGVRRRELTPRPERSAVKRSDLDDG